MKIMIAMSSVTLLGPQRLRPTVAAEIDRHPAVGGAAGAGSGAPGPVAVVTAGWQEREAEDDELAAHLGRPIVDLCLHRRLEQVFAADPELFNAHRARQDHLRSLQRLYRYRLDFALEPARELLRRPTPEDAWQRELLEAERADAIDALCELDRRHLARIAAVHRAFEEEHAPTARPAILAHRRELAALLAPAPAVVIAGGHVAVLVNRMRLFGLTELLDGKALFVWSAGAMALSERVVLFHDSPPQGMGNPEVLDAGLGLLPGIVVLPHARHRLRLDDPPRVEILARRFAPAVCIPCDGGEPALDWDGRHYRSHGGRRLGTDGRVEPLDSEWTPHREAPEAGS